MTGTSAVVVDLLGKGVRGLVGYGIWLAIPALAAAAVILLAVRQKRVTGRMWCLGLLPVVFGAFLHMICSPYPYDMGLGAFSALWRDGINRLSGGVLGGFLGISFSTWFSKIGAGIIFVLVMSGGSGRRPLTTATTTRNTTTGTTTAMNPTTTITAPGRTTLPRWSR